MKTPSTGLEKISTGISGLDEVLYGCMPEGRTTLVIGEAGASKTVLTLPLPATAVIDTWIHLSNSVEERERSRTLSIVKSRGTFAASIMREVIRTPERIDLRKVYVRDHRVLSGQRRLEEEARHRAQIALWQREIEVMSAQLLADKLALESINGEYPQVIAGESRPGKEQKTGMQARPSRKSVSAQRARSRRKGVPV